MKDLRRTLLHGLLLVLVLGLGAASRARAELPPLIPRDILFGNPEKASPKLAPDGKQIAWLAPDDKNVLQVWVQTVGGTDAKMITADKKRGIRIYEWAGDNKTLLYLQDSDGDENWHIYGVDLASGNVRDYTPFEGIRAEITALDPDYPEKILVSMNLRERTLFDVYRIDLKTGAVVLDTVNPGNVAAFAADAKFQIRAAELATPEGGSEILIRDTVDSPWQSWEKEGPEEILEFLDFSADGKSVFLRSSVGSDTARIIRKDIETGAETTIASSDKVDAGEVLIQPRTHTIQAVAFAPGRTTWTVIDPSIQEDFKGIAKLAEGDFRIGDRDSSDSTWLVGFTSDSGPVRYYSWDRKTKSGTFLFVHQPALEGLALAQVQPVVITSRDGLELHGYLTLPVGVKAKKLPMVLLVHGGPWYRDRWGFNPESQWFANRGYACLQVNFRGSTGYGKKFLNAGNKEWGLKMQDDLTDAVNWAVKKGYADPKRVAIYGGSYGGYAALAGLTITPELFACAVDIVGPSNLETLARSFPPYWKPVQVLFSHRVGNVDDPQDIELLKNASPLFKADRIVRPLLIGQGANDPRVPQVESEQIVTAIEKNGGKVVYVLYSDEGHGFARPENRLDFSARTEAFLAANLGGRLEPLAGETYPGSTAVVKVVGQ